MKLRDDTTAARWERVTEIVDGALKRPDPRERARFLRAACAGDGELRREVEELLEYEGAESGVLGGPLLGFCGAAVPAAPDAGGTPAPQYEAGGTPAPQSRAVLRPGQTVGPYRVERLLGEGGMGVVALAHDPELDRHVALKVLRRENVDDELLRRFETERRVLARLDHPHVARIFDAGTAPSGGIGGEYTDDGLPYFAMELVEGEPIDVWCDRRRLSIDDRLRLVLKVCDALGEAHRNLVVHRDLKPGNVLVTAAGEPKVVDFGIAKELDPLRDASATRTGRQPLTPAYASPEQVRGRPVTVATDVYSLGVLLYRLLCGHPPYVLDGDTLESVRKVCEEEPPPPSARTMLALEVWRDGTPTTVPPDALARARASDPRTLRRRLAGDLDGIVSKALAKDPKERYRSVDDLAADLRRHLDGEPVTARRGTALYRTGKFLRRHRWRLAAAVAVAAVLAAGAAMWLASQRRVRTIEDDQRRAAEQAAEAERQAETLTRFARNLVRSTDPDASGGHPLTAHEILAHAHEEAERSLAGEPELLAHQLEALGLAYQSLGDLEAARPLLEDSLRLRRRVYAGDHRLVARGLNNLAALHHVAGDRSRAERLYRLALAMRERLGQPPEELSTVESNLASLLAFRGELDEAEALYRRVLATRRRAYEPGDAAISNSLRSLGNVLFLKGDLEGAEAALRESLELRRAGQARSTAVASALSSLGRVYHAEGRPEDAEAALVEALTLRRELLGRRHPHVALTEKDLASLYFDLGEDAVAEVLWDHALRLLRETLPADTWELADAESRLGARLAARGRPAEAEVCLRESFEALRRLRGEQAVYTREARERWVAIR